MGQPVHDVVRGQLVRVVGEVDRVHTLTRPLHVVADVIVVVDGKPVRRLSDLTDAIEEIGVGKKVEITAVRDGRHRKVQAEITDVSRS